MLWLRRWLGEGEAALPSGKDYADLHALARAWEETEAARARFLEDLERSELDREIRYLSVTRGVHERFPL